MSDPDIKKPLDTDALAGEVSRGFDDADKLHARLARYHNAKKRSLLNLEELDNTVPFDYAQGVAIANAVNRLKSCGNYLEFHHYYTVGTVKLAKARFCTLPLICPFCAIRRASKILDSYMKRYRFIMAQNPTWKLSMITLTVKNGDDLEERFQHLQSSVARIFKRRRDYLDKGRGKTEFRKIHGYVGTYEVTENNGFGDVKETGWHPHAHIMVLHTTTFDYAALQAEWKEITGDSHVLNVSAARHPNEPELDFMESFKYTVKFSNLTPEQNIKAWLVLRGRRLLFNGGAFRGVEVPASLADEPLDGLPYIQLLYRYAASGYSLVSTVAAVGVVDEADAATV
jgi:plasmid rolling circle replication initiator protein Rep